MLSTDPLIDRWVEDEVLGLLEECRDDPGLFNAAILGRPPYWWRQVEICRSVVSHRATIVESGNSVGKSYLAAGLILWWLYCFPESLVIVTAPSQTLLGTVLFKELRKAHENSRIPLGGMVTNSPKASPQTLILGAGWQAIGLATKGVERLSGQHSPYLLQVVDEGSGIDDDIGEALDSQNPFKQVVFGNPLRAEGYFARLAKIGEGQRLDASIPPGERTHTIRIPSTDSPDIRAPRSFRGLADAGFLADMRRKHGETSLWYRTHIRALRPTASHDTLIPVDWLDACAGIPRAAVARLVDAGPRRISADLGEGVGRDKTVIIVRDDLGVLCITAGHGLGLAEAAAEIARLAIKFGVREDHITFDALGVGRDLPLHLERHGITEALAYKGSFGGGHDFTNLRGACAWAFRNRIDPSQEGFIPFAIPADEHWPAMRGEILAFRYDLVGQQTRLESKQDLAKRLGHSPDYADALFQSFCMAVER